MQRARLPYLLIPLAAFLATLPLLIQGCSCGHDFDFHLLSWMEAARQFTHGNLHPHWAYTPAYNAGEPRFVFYPRSPGASEPSSACSSPGRGPPSSTPG
jgi:hypothetical protein